MKSRSEENEFEVPIKNFGKVADGIFRGALPDEPGYRALVEKLAVVRVCSMIEHERRADRDRALASGIEEWRSMPFSDRDAPEPARVHEWLALIRSVKRGGPIYAHCRGGRHRTGVLFGVYRVADCGWTKEQAYNEMRLYGWYSALGHAPLLEWFFHAFDPKEFKEQK
jgi:protein-tyrosine phosphatase